MLTIILQLLLVIDLKAFGLAMTNNKVHSLRVYLIGEPKTGTTWTEQIVRAMSDEQGPKNNCTKSYGNSGSKQNSPKAKQSFTMDFLDGTRVSFTSKGKHALPYNGAMGTNCAHNSLFATGNGGCGVNLTFPHIPSLETLLSCERRCAAVLESIDLADRTRIDSNLRGTTYLNIHRDPRATAISSCFHLHGENMTKTLQLEKCLKNFYANVATAMKFRELFLRSNLMASHVIDLRYERLLLCPETEFAKIASALNLHASSADLRTVQEKTSASAMRTNTKAGNYKANTLRDGGKKSHRDYGLADEIVVWMDQVYSSLFGDEAYNCPS